MLIKDLIAWRAMKRLSTPQAASLLALTYFGQWGWRKYRSRNGQSRLGERMLDGDQLARQDAIADLVAD